VSSGADLKEPDSMGECSPSVTFVQLNDSWHAEPNAPDPVAEVLHGDIHLYFRFYKQTFGRSGKTTRGHLIFHDCQAWRLGLTNDEGWYAGQCRYSSLAPKWGEFYEISGQDGIGEQPTDWHRITPVLTVGRHFLFYFRDETFEAIARDWTFERNDSRFWASDSRNRQ
jgi:hypothetical protein